MEYSPQETQSSDYFLMKIFSLGVLSVSAVSFSLNVWNDWNIWND